LSSRKEANPSQPASGFSRRGFIRGAGIAGGALGAGVLEKDAVAGTPPAVVGPGAVPIALTINGKPVSLTVEPRVTLSNALREHLGMTGSKQVCDRGTCGACTVLLDGKPVYSCSVLAIDAQGRNIDTIEGLAAPGELHPISQAFWNNDAQQCGYCTSGFVMSVKGLLDEHPNPTMDEVKHGLGGNLCRCGAYMGIRKAALEAAQTVRKGGKNG
jgi:aerobic-type carbon monoxide dehydrogenase small subunit (CoxS/CutS family)